MVCVPLAASAPVAGACVGVRICASSAASRAVKTATYPSSATRHVVTSSSGGGAGRSRWARRSPAPTGVDSPRASPGKAAAGSAPAGHHRLNWQHHQPAAGQAIAAEGIEGARQIGGGRTCGTRQGPSLNATRVALYVTKGSASRSAGPSIRRWRNAASGSPRTREAGEQPRITQSPERLL